MSRGSKRWILSKDGLAGRRRAFQPISSSGALASHEAVGITSRLHQRGSLLNTGPACCLEVENEDMDSLKTRLRNVFEKNKKITDRIREEDTFGHSGHLTLLLINPIEELLRV